MPKVIVKYLAIWLLAVGLAVSCGSFSAAAQSQTTKTMQPSPRAKSVVYINKKYGFRFKLPETWKGFSISETQWTGGDGRTYQSEESIPPPEKGPFISIVHPLSTKENPRQDIPIMVFSHAQWRLVEQGNLIVSAAPIGPSEIGRNAKYVFALPLLVLITPT